MSCPEHLKKLEICLRDVIYGKVITLREGPKNPLRITCARLVGEHKRGDGLPGHFVTVRSTDFRPTRLRLIQVDQFFFRKLI